MLVFTKPYRVRVQRVKEFRIMLNRVEMLEMKEFLYSVCKHGR